MLVINKNKNFFEFIDSENGKLYARIDINSGNVYGKTDRVVVNTPSGLKDTIFDNRKKSLTLAYLDYIAFHKNSYYAKNLAHDARNLKVLSLLDRLDNLGVIDDVAEESYYVSSLYNIDNDGIDFLNKNFKKLVELLKKQPHEYFMQYIRIMEAEAVKQKYDIPEDAEEALVNGFSKLLKKYPNYGEAIHYYCFKCKMPTFFSDVFYDGNGKTIYAIERLLEWCKALGIEKPEKTKAFIQYYVDIKNAYEIAKERISKEKIAYNYSKHANALNFENDNYTVVLPTCGNDLVQEGIRQRNCVGGYVDRIVDGRTYVVFVRRKDDVGKNFITCEVTNSGYINQFLLACNRSIDYYDTELQNLKKEYQRHLLNNWAKE